MSHQAVPCKIKNTDDVASAVRERLTEYARLQSRAGELTPSRGYWWMMLWSALLISADVGVLLFTFAASTAGEISGRTGYSLPGVLITPVLAFSALLIGARERFNIRTKPSPLVLLFYGMALAGFFAAITFSGASVAYPWWLNVLVPLILCAAMAAAALRGLIATSQGSTPSHGSAASHGTAAPRGTAAPQGNAPLGVTSRLMTALIGVALGIMLATAADDVAAADTSSLTMIFFTVSLVSPRLAFGLDQAGYQWGSIHWVCFGVSAAIMFASALAMTFTTWFTATSNVTAGVLVFIVMVVAAFLPQRGTRQGQ